MSVLSEETWIEESRWLTDIRKHPAVRRLNAFLRSPGYILLIALMTVVCYCFSAELYIYAGFVLIGLFISFLGDDLLGVMPIVICCYVSPSPANNPGISTTSIFYPGNGGGLILALVGLFLAAVVIRLVCDRCIGGNFQRIYG